MKFKKKNLKFFVIALVLIFVGEYFNLKSNIYSSYSPLFADDIFKSSYKILWLKRLSFYDFTDHKIKKKIHLFHENLTQEAFFIKIDLLLYKGEKIIQNFYGSKTFFPDFPYKEKLKKNLNEVNSIFNPFFKWFGSSREFSIFILKENRNANISIKVSPVYSFNKDCNNITQQEKEYSRIRNFGYIVGRPIEQDETYLKFMEADALLNENWKEKSFFGLYSLKFDKEKSKYDCSVLIDGIDNQSYSKKLEKAIVFFSRQVYGLTPEGIFFADGEEGIPVESGLDYYWFFRQFSDGKIFYYNAVLNSSEKEFFDVSFK